MSRTGVVVTGIGLVTPLGVGKSHVWSNLVNGHHGIVKLDEDAFKRLPSRIAGRVPSFPLADPEDAHHPRFIQLALKAASDSILDARIELGEHAGVAIGSGMSCVNEISQQAAILETNGPRRVSPHFVPRILGNMAAGHICMRYGLRGPMFSPSTACATGASAIGDAFRAIKHGYARVMLAGACESCVDPLSFAGFTQARALTTRFNEDPSRASRPFDKDRSGFVLGEGAAVLVLEDREHARRRNAPQIYGEILGYGTSADAYHVTASHPDGLGAKLAMMRSVEEAGISTAQIDYINAHGTSTPLGDRAELQAIASVFQNDIFVSSTKGATGHLLSAAGAVESAFTLLTLHSVALILSCFLLTLCRVLFRRIGIFIPWMTA
jgi:3-oxoacyl-[acyl-carrier-protein] synthase II